MTDPQPDHLAEPRPRGLDRLRDPVWACQMNDAGEQWRSGLLKGEVAWLIAEVERLRGLLRRLEWGYPTEGCCPACDGDSSRGHTEDCELAAELRSTSGEDR